VTAVAARSGAANAAGERATTVPRVPGPPELLPGRPEAVINLQIAEGAELAHAAWRYSDAEVREIDFVSVGPDLGPSGPPSRTYDIVPHAQGAEFDDRSWRVLAPEETMRRLGGGRVSFNWYRTAVTIPERVGGFDPTGSTVVFEVVVDDYAEVWVDGELPLALGDAGGRTASGFNAPNRVVLTPDARPGRRFQLAVFGVNGPISASPANYIWMRSAALEFHRPTADVVPLQADGLEAEAERVAGGFEGTAGPVWTRDGALLFSSLANGAIYRWSPEGRVSVFRPKSAAAGLAFDAAGLLTICQPERGRVIRIEPHGNVTVLADGLEAPHDLVHRADGTLLVATASGVVRASPEGALTVEPGEATGLALSPDERLLYVGTPDGVIRDGELFSEARADGLAVDREGNVYACGPDGIRVLAPDGALLGTVRLPEAPSNLAWGDDDARTLYVTALTSVYRVRLRIPDRQEDHR
jgi:gluconolactonase